MNNNIKEFKDFLDKLVHGRKKILWNETIDEYAAVMEKMRLILSNDKINKNISNSIINKLDNFIDQCRNQEFHLAVVGVVKAGKSTLINALLNKEVAATAITPETAALTKFRSGKGKNFIKVQFYTDKDWRELWATVQENKSSVFLDEYKDLKAEEVKNSFLNHSIIYEEFDDEINLKEKIKKWTSSKNAEHYFVKEVEVGLAKFDLPEQIIFVDTPGLDDVVKYRSDITRNYIDRANAVILCVPCQRMTSGDLVTMYNVFSNCRYNPEKVYTIGTQLDALSDPVKDWREQKEQWIKYLKGSDCYGSYDLAAKNIFGLAAYMYNQALNADNLSEKEKKELQSLIIKYFDLEYINAPNWEEVKNITFIPKFRNEFFNEIVEKYQRFMFEDLRENYKILRKELIQIFEIINLQQNELLDSSKTDFDTIRNKREECINRLKLMKDDEVMLKECIDIVKDLTKVRVNSLYDKINELI